MFSKVMSYSQGSMRILNIMVYKLLKTFIIIINDYKIHSHCKLFYSYLIINNNDN